ncbi:hypothetical protein [Sulfuricella sp.]|uniref:hypothetical protein n=1 Tax=Sulfuricella sp. TaxID=2099377 RepID=UPI002C1F652A|nr:hypothetical protein [Sulfuricella sp.]HUX64908.1 hypothetical protein [Sulfuricella sp.]
MMSVATELTARDSAWLFTPSFTRTSFLNASMMSATNTMIVLNVTSDPRDTAFGIGSTARAIAFMVGPMGGTMFATFSLKAGFATVGGVMLALAGVVAFAVREPTGEK